MNSLPHAMSAVLFDLDGTLVDTAPDMVAALYRVCRESGAKEPDFAIARQYVSQGSRGLVSLAFPQADDEQTRILVSRFLDIYAENVCRESVLFEGMQEVLVGIETAGIPWGIVTNKPERFTLPLVAALNLHRRAACVVSGDTVARSKPDPLPLLHACQLLRLTPQQCVYVGDDERDVVAGKAAGMATVAARYGYILHSEKVSAWQADGVIEDPRDMLAWFEG